MPKCPKCQTHYDDLFDVSNCISSHQEEKAVAIMRPRVVDKNPKPQVIPKARWITLPTGLFNGTPDQMDTLQRYFELFTEAFDSFLDFPTKWGKYIPLVKGVARPPSRREEPSMMWDEQLQGRIPVSLMPNRRKKSTHGYFKYKLKRHTMQSIPVQDIESMTGRDAALLAVDGEIHRAYNCFITVAPGLPFQSVLCTLAHEMCHYAQYIECNRWITREALGGGWGKSHGDTFVKQMKAFNAYSRSVGSDIRVDKKCHSGRGHDKEIYDRIEWIRDNLKKGDVFYWEWPHSDESREPYVGVYQCRGRYAHRVKGYHIEGTKVHDYCIPWSCIKYVWRHDFPDEHIPDGDAFEELKQLIDVLPNKGRVV